jgi:transposase
MVSGRVVIGIDPHKASWTAAAVDSTLRVLASIRVEVNRDGYRQLRRFARRFTHASWAIEGAAGLGAPLVARLAADDIAAVDVPAKLSARVRLLSHGHNRKTDQADAVSVAVAALTAQTLRNAEVDQTSAALRVLTDHREDLVRARTQAVNRLHVLLTHLTPAGLADRLTADAAAALLRTVRGRTPLSRAHRQVAVDLVAEIRRLDRRITAADKAIKDAVTASGSALTGLYGVGDIVAAIVLARAGTAGRFPSAAHFASFAGVAPIEVSSGDVVRHRLCRAGDRQLNRALHVMAITQIRGDTDGKAYYQRKRQAGKSHREALRCLKRRLADVVYRTLLNDDEAPSMATP